MGPPGAVGPEKNSRLSPPVSGPALGKFNFQRNNAAAGPHQRQDAAKAALPTSG